MTPPAFLPPARELESALAAARVLLGRAMKCLRAGVQNSGSSGDPNDPRLYALCNLEAARQLVSEYDYEEGARE